MTTAMVARATVRELDARTRQQESFNRELRHRSRNLLAVIQALSARGPRAENPIDFFREFSDRLESLAKASDLLRIGTEAEGHLPELIERTIAPFAQGSRIRLSGPACLVPDQSCIPLIMAVHELGTNAVKHGALSDPAGWVDLRWFLAPTATGSICCGRNRVARWSRPRCTRAPVRTCCAPSRVWKR
jgi:two-component sensor histidine kinase